MYIVVIATNQPCPGSVTPCADQLAACLLFVSGSLSCQCIQEVAYFDGTNCVLCKFCMLVIAKQRFVYTCIHLSLDNLLVLIRQRSITWHCRYVSRDNITMDWHDQSITLIKKKYIVRNKSIGLKTIAAVSSCYFSSIQIFKKYSRDFSLKHIMQIDKIKKSLDAKICGGRDHCFICDIIKSRNTQIPNICSHHLFGKPHIS